MLFYKIDNGKLVETKDRNSKIDFYIGESSGLDFIVNVDVKNIYLIKELIKESKEMLMPKIEIHQDFVYIYMFDIEKESLTKGEAYEIIVTKNELIVFVEKQNYDYEDKLRSIATRIQGHITKEKLLVGLFNHIINDDMDLYRELDETIAELEVTILKKPVDANNDIILLKKNLLYLKHYYEQFVEVAWDLEGNENEVFTAEGLILIKNFTRKLERINNRILALKDYMTQVREAYQAQVDIRLNATMETFTVITAIFLPLTLLTSWYGMNFVAIKEFNWEYGYYYVIVFAVCIAITMWLYFKKKNMFR